MKRYILKKSTVSVERTRGDETPDWICDCGYKRENCVCNVQKKPLAISTVGLMLGSNFKAVKHTESLTL